MQMAFGLTPGVITRLDSVADLEEEEGQACLQSRVNPVSSQMLRFSYRTEPPARCPSLIAGLRFLTSSRALWALHGWHAVWEFSALEGAQASAETHVGRCGFKATAQWWRLPGSPLWWAGPEPLWNPILAFFGLIQETPGILLWP